MKILIVEDEIIPTETVKERLILEGFSVSVADEGSKGLQIALAEHPDLILLDLLMPKLDGLTMLKRLRSDSWGKNANVIVLSNLSDPRSITKGVDIGLSDISEYMLKTDLSLDDMVKEIKKRLVVK